MFSNINFIVFIIICVYEIFAYQCKNENNEPVDWYVLYKIPKLKKSNNNLIENGVGYMYITSETIENNGWILSQWGIDDLTSIPAYTLNPLYNSTVNVSYILYNDQPPDQPQNSRGHTKGAALTNSTHGLWLVHSVPHFPRIGKNQVYTYPETGKTYGQSFLCITLNITNINYVGKQLYYNEPHIYEKLISDTVMKAAPLFGSVDNDNSVNKPPWFHIQNITTLKQNTFISFAKSKEFNKELYVDLVAPFIQTNLYVESWQNGDGKLKSNCNYTFEVDNIQSIALTLNITFKSTVDHSKWAITHKQRFDEPNVYTCIGDINRAEHQKVRGGGTVCLQNKKLWQQYLNIAANIELCK